MAKPARGNSGGAAPADGQRGRATTIRLLQAAMAAALAVPILLFVSASYISYRNIRALADERIERSLDVEGEQALKVLQSANLAFIAIDDMVAGRTDAQIRNDAPDLRGKLKGIAGVLQEVQSISMFGPDGRVQVTTAALPAQDYSSADFFRAHLAGDPGLYVGTTQQTASGGERYFTISRARRGADETFEGVIQISVLSSEFTRFYSRIVGSNYSRIVSNSGLQYAMIRDDGVILARYPVLSAPGMRLDANSGFGHTVAASPLGGYYTARSEVDDVERRFGIRRLPGYPIYMSAGIDTAEMRSELIDGMAVHLIYGIPVTLVLFGALANVLVRTRRLYAEQDRREVAEDALRQVQKMEAIGQLSGGIAHDFNNLLMIIIGNLEIVQRMLEAGNLVQARACRSIGNAMHGAKRAAALTQRLLAFSRQQPLNPRPLDLNRQLADISDLLARALGETISMEVVGSAGLWPVELDHAEVEAAIVNLAVNARDAMPHGGKLTVETSNAYLDEDYCRRHADIRPGQYVLMSVTDTGIGMPQSVIERVFEPFFTTKAAGSGTGLGLSQVYGFVKQSGGHVSIYSEVGQGTTVKLYLPRMRGAASAKDEITKPVAAAAGNGEHILVVEDDDDVRSYVVDALRGLNYRVAEAADADHALGLIDTEKFDLLLTDVVLPGMNGRQLAEQTQFRQGNIRVIFMTGYSRNAIVHQGRLDPGIELLQKPITGSELAGKVRKILDAPVPAPADPMMSG